MATITLYDVTTGTEYACNVGTVPSALANNAFYHGNGSVTPVHEYVEQLSSGVHVWGIRRSAGALRFNIYGGRCEIEWGHFDETKQFVTDVNYSIFNFPFKEGFGFCFGESSWPGTISWATDQPYFFSARIGESTSSLEISYVSNTDAVKAWSTHYLASAIVPEDHTPGGSSKPGGGGGSFDNTSVTIPSYTFSPNETSSHFVGGAASSSLVSIYLPTKAQLAEFASQLWDPSLANTLAKMSVDPIDFVVSFHMLPISPPVAGQADVVYGNVIFKNSLKFNYSATQYTTVDMGTIDVKEYWGNFLDYGPFTKVSIYLPYIGFQNLDPDDVMSGKIHLVYNIDLVSGACLASLYVTRSADGTDLSAPLYTFGGNMASKIPLSSVSGGNAAIAAASAVLPVATTVAAGTMAGVGGAMASEAVQAGNTAALAEAHAVKGAATALQGASAGAVLSGKLQVGRSGGFEQSSGFLGPQTPYLVISRPIQSIPNGYNTYEGYPSNITAKLSDLSGFTQIESIHLDGIVCTETERDELEALLKTGVII